MINEHDQLVKLILMGFFVVVKVNQAEDLFHCNHEEAAKKN